MMARRIHRILRPVFLTAGPTSLLFLLWGAGADTDARWPEEGRFDAPGPVGMVLLPGAGVEPRAYVPLAAALAGRGIPVRILELPWRTAFTESMVRELFARVGSALRANEKRWILAGHSRGAALAARYEHEHPGEAAGLMLMGTTHPRDFDLSGHPVPVMKLHGSADRMAPLTQARARAHLLPAGTRWEIVEGGNHSGFAHYHFQLFDGRATVTREEQQAQAVAAIAALSEEIARESRELRGRLRVRP